MPAIHIARLRLCNERVQIATGAPDYLLKHYNEIQTKLAILDKKLEWLSEQSAKGMMYIKDAEYELVMSYIEAGLI